MALFEKAYQFEQINSAVHSIQSFCRPPKFNLAPRNKSTEPDYTLTFNIFASEVYGDSKTSESVYFEKIFKNRFVTLVGGLQGYAEQRIGGKILKTVNFAHYPTEQEYRLPSYGVEEVVEFFTDNADIAKKCSDAALNHTVHEIRAKFVELGQGLSAHKLEMVYISEPLPGLSAVGSVTNNKYLERLQKRLSGMSQSTQQMGQSLNPNIPVDQSVSKSMTASGTPKKIIKQNVLQSQFIPVNASQALQMQLSNNPALQQSRDGRT
ncbi:MAG: hypothetical protein EZS28_043479 [Streblomastix strix]|uniref:Uncharacterized protein n=1 Tax=Streblomastix strix TaxID=222440 RepID=A0A5J4TRQ5_9EUKA|nr:MAG: hypothetical protein EZS28_043479 [Streblomastix strix]